MATDVTWRRRAPLGAFAILATAPAPASAQMGNCEDPFPEPLFLIECEEMACPHDGYSLVADIYDVGYAFRVLGGPYTDRGEVEVERNRLFQAGDLPDYAVFVQLIGPERQQFGAFWLGAKPVCTHVQRPLDGDVLADFGLGGRPEHFPLPFALQDHTDEVARLRQECTETE